MSRDATSLVERFDTARLLSLVEGERGPHLPALTGVATGAKPFAAALLTRSLGCPLALVLPSREEAERVHQDLEFYTGRPPGAPRLRTAFLPALEPEPYLDLSPHLGVVLERTETLQRVLEAEVDVVVLPAEALAMKLPPPGTFRSLVRRLELGDRLDRDALLRTLVRAGYRNQDMVGTAGEFAVRGGIVDVFTPGRLKPVRLELLGDELESLRSFDPLTQRSDEELIQVDLLPLREFPLADDAYSKFAAWCDGQGDAGSAEPLRKLRSELKERGTFPGIEHYAPAFVGPLVDLTRYLEGYALVVDEPELTMASVEKLEAGLLERHNELLARDDAAPAPAELMLRPEALRALLAEQGTLALQTLGASDGPTASLNAQPPRRYEGRIKDLVSDLVHDRDAGLDSVVVVPSEAEADRVQAMLSEYDVAYLEGANAEAIWQSRTPAEGRVAVTIGRLSSGFRSPALGLSVLAAVEVFGGAPPRARRRRASSAAFASDFRDLKVGDCVVHVDHGIGRFLGLKAVAAGDTAQEYMVLGYASEDKLYVPLDRLDLVQKYSGLETIRPRIDSLGGTTWTRVKSKIKAELRDMAAELLNLYAARQVLKGHAFPHEGYLEREFIDSFAFEPTPDQQGAAEDTMADMQSTRCMDRLVVGDVGYGKTEVAMRAAFKAVADSKQVAVLSPTTVLALQHLNTFRERFKAFPVTIEMLSRFRTPREIKAVLASLAEGKVDIVVGTHRLLSKDIRFKDLGLLVVDEEQRFGVAHKERIKQLKRGVDVLTLTATPIPRTLQMALTGLRDMSAIETPPPNRIAIETSVVRWNPRIIHDAILHELERGGQVYFIHNRVQSIYAMASTLRRIAPFARFGVGHGQMRDGELEGVMVQFIERGFDVLVATTIIENGLDLPNVNTLIVNRAHRFGLAQLYQLRGRVGRSDKPAYAYLLVPPKLKLTPLARRRLHAIEEFSELGSGFRLAARDLELRGAGSVLGKQQHGHIGAVGFELYARMLEQTVAELTGKKVEVAASAQLSLGVDVHVPEDFVPEANQRLVLYQRIASAHEVEDIDALGDEIRDRFGETPASVVALLEQARLKLEAQQLGVESIERRGARAVVRFSNEASFDPQALVAFVKRADGRRFHPDGRLELEAPAGVEALGFLREALGELE